MTSGLVRHMVGRTRQPQQFGTSTRVPVYRNHAVRAARDLPRGLAKLELQLNSNHREILELS